MEGTLAAANRSIGIEILDGAESLYNEHDEKLEDFDPNPLFKQSSKIDMYGRTWNFDIRSTQSFREQTSTTQPQMILFGGLFIDGMLFLLFMSLARANRRAVSFANILTQEYKVKAQDLEQANDELEEFAYRTSHDLRSPLMSSLGVLSIATKSIKEKDEQKALISITHARKSLNTLQVLIEDILDLTKIKNLDEESSPIDFTAELKKILDNLSNMEGIDDIVISQDLQFQKTLSAKENRLTLIMQNLISNAIKYKDLGKENCFVKISTYEQDGLFVLDVEDNGIGIPEDKQADLFLMFKRFHPQAGYGSGLGLYMIKKSAHILGGKYRIYRYRQRFTFYAEHTFIIRRYIIWLFT
jgi:signal transduction histidine kinase